MLDLTLYQAKQAFVDSRKVKNWLNKVQRKALGSWGSYVRRRAQTSMRKRKKPSPAGQPPSAHENPLLRKFLYFVIDKEPTQPDVVVGPIKLGKSITPALMERGGTKIVGRKRETVTYEERPFMGPAAVYERERLQWHYDKAKVKTK